ncbi:MAG: hypothetical protein U0470_05820 [Anaerolineae bacterium]
MRGDAHRWPTSGRGWASGGRSAAEFNRRALAAMRAQEASSAKTGKPYGMRTLDRRQGGSYVELIDDFEGVILDNQKWFWNLDSDLPPTRFGEYFGALSQCTSKPRKAGDVQSFWAIGGGADGSKLKCDDLYPSGSASEAALLLDLRYWDPATTQQLELNYDVWLNTRLGVENGIVQDGLFVVLYIRKAGCRAKRQVVLNAQYAQSRNWFDAPSVVNLLRACDYYKPSECYELAGREIIVKFVFKSQRRQAGMDPPSTYPNGSFIDNITLLADQEPGPPLTLPTWTAVPTFVVTIPPEGTPSATPTLDLETDTPGPSETPEIETPAAPTTGTPVQPTDTPEGSASPTPDMPATDTPSPEATDTAEPTDTPRPTATPPPRAAARCTCRSPTPTASDPRAAVRPSTIQGREGGAGPDDRTRRGRPTTLSPAPSIALVRTRYRSRIAPRCCRGPPNEPCGIERRAVRMRWAPAASRRPGSPLGSISARLRCVARQSTVIC